jgi:prefoldin subunit 5
LKTNSTLRIQELNAELDEALNNLRKTTDDLNESRQRHKADLQEYENYRRQN